MEIYNHQQTLSMIDKQGHAKVLAKKRLEKLIDSLYFGRFDFVYASEAVQALKAFRIKAALPPELLLAQIDALLLNG